MEAVEIQTAPEPELTADPKVLEELKALFLAEDFLREAPRRLYRVEHPDRRYFQVNASGVKWFRSVTNSIEASMPTSPWLIKWIAQHGLEKAEQLKEMAGEYGTFMHAQIQEYLISKFYNLDRVEEVIEAWEPKTKWGTDGWADRIREDMVAFHRFCRDFNLVPLAIELVLASDEMELAGAIDLVARITVEVEGLHPTEVYKSGKNKGQPKPCKVPWEIIVLIDFKNGRKGFWESNEIQLHAYKKIWEANFPDIKIERVYNWGPKEWRTEPNYAFIDQTEKKSKEKLPHLMALAALNIPLKPRPRAEVFGTLAFGEDSENVREKDLEALIASSYKGDDNVTDQTSAAA